MMNRMLKSAALFVALSVISTSSVGQPTTSVSVDLDALRMAYYAYDPSIALNTELKDLPDKQPSKAALRTRYHLAYDSAHDQRVTAIVTIPAKYAAPHPAVILVAGSGGHKDTDYIRTTSDLMSGMGYATMSIDSQYHGERSRPGHTGDFHFIDSAANRDAWVQTVIDLRRAVDYLASREDIDKAKIAYMGFSQGGMVGATFLGVEPRICAAVLAVPGGGMVDWAKRTNRFPPEKSRDVEVNASIIDPIHFIGRFAPRPLLVCSAKNDELIPQFATEALYDAAKEPKQIKWYEATHTLTQAVIPVTQDIRAFFLKHLGERKTSTAALSPTR